MHDSLGPTVRIARPHMPSTEPIRAPSRPFREAFRDLGFGVLSFVAFLAVGGIVLLIAPGGSFPPGLHWSWSLLGLLMGCLSLLAFAISGLFLLRFVLRFLIAFFWTSLRSPPATASPVAAEPAAKPPPTSTAASA